MHRLTPEGGTPRVETLTQAIALALEGMLNAYHAGAQRRRGEVEEGDWVGEDAEIRRAVCEVAELLSGERIARRAHRAEGTDGAH